MDGWKIRQDHMRYDLRKFSFSNRVRTLWNSLPDIVVKAAGVCEQFQGKIGQILE